MNELTLLQKQKEIQDLLEESTESHLADGLYLVPEAHILALHSMIAHQRKQNVYKAVIRHNVVQDVSVILEGKPGNAIFSNPFLNAN